MQHFNFSGLLFLCLLTACQGTSRGSDEDLRRQCLSLQQKAIDYLLTQRAPDGGWRSTTHGILKGGAAYTPYIVDALQQSGIAQLDTFDFSRSYSFLLSQLDTSGAIGQKGPYVMEYPVYATAYLLKIWPLRPVRFDTLFQPHFERYLLGQQFNESRGILPEHAAYGAWGFGEQHLPSGEVGHVDLSHTRRVLEALQKIGHSPAHPCWEQAASFLAKLQNEDGGFCSSTYTLGSNKADDYDHHCVSYATATADGLLALLSMPEPDQSRVSAAARWLLTHEDWKQVSGIPEERPGDWEKVLFYYHISVRAQAYAKMAALDLLPADNDWRTVVIQLLAERQLPDGSFSNPWGAPNKEDDPLLATALVIKTITSLLTVKRLGS